MTVLALGLCTGAATVTGVLLSRDAGMVPGGATILATAVRPHEGHPRRVVSALLEDWRARGTMDRVAVTGRGFKDFLHLTALTEARAVEAALAWRFRQEQSAPPPAALVSLGGETFLAYLLDGVGRIHSVVSGNKCAAGTGEFFLQQIRRLGFTLDQVADLEPDPEPHPVSGRCAVFCKSDCTHAANRGVPRSRLLAGLCRMMAGKVLELLDKAGRPSPVLLTGGVTANPLLRHFLVEQGVAFHVPPEAPWFEALGAALWALDHPTRPLPPPGRLFRSLPVPQGALPPLESHVDRVVFHPDQPLAPRPGMTCLVGLDVGSTTTKAVVMEEADGGLLASVYLRTNGDPVSAARACYQGLIDRLRAAGCPPEALRIRGLGVTGSGRAIAGLHGGTDGVVNEIIAHATAAARFDPGVDTLFEIGGQDAKYTHLSQGVPGDYAMNEACSAGTGSFLEEAAGEVLGVALEDIAAAALAGTDIPDFSDQCAAFIASDVKNAIHAGRGTAAIVAGLVYAVCRNYLNRVKGNRPVGDRILMQGGVCCNRAVPLAMAGLTGRTIIVPPQPGLMGALGAALEVRRRLAGGELEPQTVDLAALAGRTLVNGRSFRCPGRKEACDRLCTIAIVRIGNRNHPFGGACGKFDHRRGDRVDPAGLDWVRAREDRLWQPIAASSPVRGRVGFNRSFLMHELHPLLAGFFAALGYQPVLPGDPGPREESRPYAPFCFPGELAHGYFRSLLREIQPPDFLFLPHVRALPAQSDQSSAQTCPVVQTEPSWLRAAQVTGEQRPRVFSPVLDLTAGLDGARRPLAAIARRLGQSRRAIDHAWRAALAHQEAFRDWRRELGRRLLAELAAAPGRFAVVLFSRPYSGLAREANMNIPLRLAGRGVMVMPFDCLAPEDSPSRPGMYWGVGQRLLAAARLVADHPQLYGVWVTNFSCGPDSFLLGYFRDLMAAKPALTLELDSHTADAGLETRIEAFLEVAALHQRRGRPPFPAAAPAPFQPARIQPTPDGLRVVTSAGELLPLDHERVTALVPWVGTWFTAALAAALRGVGVQTLCHGPTSPEVLQRGRRLASGKECLPLILTTGMLFGHLDRPRRPGEVLLYFMPTAAGPCRFGQYAAFMNDLIRREQVADAALLSLTSEDSYGGLGSRFTRLTWWGIVVTDLIEDIRALLLANAREPRMALDRLEAEWNLILESLEKGSLRGLAAQLTRSARVLAVIAQRRPPGEVPRVALAGEIYVRRDPFASNRLTELLAERGFATLCSGIAEWVHYSDHLVTRDLVDPPLSRGRKVGFWIRQRVMAADEARLRRALAPCGLLPPRPPSLRAILAAGTAHLPLALTGEAVLTTGQALVEDGGRVCGLIAVGPFGCLPNRISQAILEPVLGGPDRLPFLALETDGAPLPQLAHARLDAFCLQAERYHRHRAGSGPAVCASGEDPWAV
ncbi:MAG: activase [Magnetococcales bacterium]|nr:activase [Magnetococcales bacterium]